MLWSHVLPMGTALWGWGVGRRAWGGGGVRWSKGWLIGTFDSSLVPTFSLATTFRELETGLSATAS